jgi:hypothetical protein
VRAYTLGHAPDLRAQRKLVDFEKDDAAHAQALTNDQFLKVPVFSDEQAVPYRSLLQNDVI